MTIKTDEIIDAIRSWEDTNGPMPVGLDIRWNHGACGDTRGRLYIKKAFEGRHVLKAFCHNCGSAYYKKLGATPVPAFVPPLTPTAKSRFIHPAFAYNKEDWPTEAIEWVNKYPSNPFNQSIAWVPSWQRLALPICDIDDCGRVGSDLGYQFRAVFPDQNPKYLTFWKDEFKNRLPLMDYHARSVVIVEDLMSAWAIRACGYTVIPMLGSHLPLYLLPKLVRNYRRQFVWFDNDNKIVRDKSSMTVKLLNTMGGKAVDICPYPPKEAKTMHPNHLVGHLDSR
jgi:hypothetical protein